MSNEREAGFCQWCRQLVELDHMIGYGSTIADHGEACPGRFHRAATLVFGPNWISWTVAANAYVRSVLIDPVPPELDWLRAS